jgi:succinate dehydrogenase / fumarate reductase cytochrome b subunit
MAITGIMIIGFVILHMIGNWKIFLPDVDSIPDIDIYGHALRELLVPFLPAHVALWILRT